MKPKSKTIYTSRDGESIYFSCERGVLLVAKSKNSAALWLDSADLIPEQLSKHFEALLNVCPGSQHEFKLVGASELVVLWKNFLKSKSSSVQAAERSGKFEVYFIPAEGKLQISKQEEVADPNKKIRVLIVDDSKTICVLLKKVFSSDPAIEVVGVAEKPSEAEVLLKTLKPDVMTLDVHMPEMDGVTFLKKILPLHPIPTIMISSISLEEGPAILNAIEAGAVDYIQKPTADQLSVVAAVMIEKIKVAATVKVKLPQHAVSSRLIRKSIAQTSSEQIIAIGSSTGGTEALKNILIQLPENIPPIVIVQHIPAVFSKAFADRMNSLCPFEVIEAKNGDAVIPNRVLIAAGGTQMRLRKKSNGEVEVVVDDSAPVNRHKPSVDVLFDSAADQLGTRCLGVILTGMGADGAKGMLKMRQAGCHTVAQNEESCVVFGMPREAIKLGGAEKIAHLDDIPSILLNWLA